MIGDVRMVAVSLMLGLMLLAEAWNNDLYLRQVDRFAGCLGRAEAQVRADIAAGGHND